jgi:hypothetical protein
MLSRAFGAYTLKEGADYAWNLIADDFSLSIRGRIAEVAS